MKETVVEFDENVNEEMDNLIQEGSDVEQKEILKQVEHREKYVDGVLYSKEDYEKCCPIIPAISEDAPDDCEVTTILLPNDSEVEAYKQRVELENNEEFLDNCLHLINSRSEIDIEKFYVFDFQGYITGLQIEAQSLEGVLINKEVSVLEYESYFDKTKPNRRLPKEEWNVIAKSILCEDALAQLLFTGFNKLDYLARTKDRNEL